ncbi:MAG: hypothetical protein HONBIEJF_00861 [Fimbriimonadaceae bacterium]|nr:hypothetical protein [Fimbriimonadaceae bacterium]
MRLIVAFPDPAFVFSRLPDAPPDLVLGLTPERVVEHVQSYRQMVQRATPASAVLIDAIDDHGDLLAWSLAMVRNEIEDSCLALEDLLEVPVTEVLVPAAGAKTGDGHDLLEIVLPPGRKWLPISLQDVVHPATAEDLPDLGGPGSWYDLRQVQR